MEWAGQNNMWNNPNGDDALMSLLFAEDDAFAQALQGGSPHEPQPQQQWGVPQHKPVNIKQEAPQEALFAEWAAESAPVGVARAGWGLAAAPPPHAASRLVTTQLQRTSTKSSAESAHSVVRRQGLFLPASLPVPPPQRGQRGVVALAARASVHPLCLSSCPVMHTGAL